MSKPIDNVPKWVRIAVGILALANTAYGLFGYLDLSFLFKNQTGLDLAKYDPEKCKL